MALRQVSLHIMATTLAISQNCISLVVVVVVDDVAVFWERRLLYHITHDHILQY